MTNAPAVDADGRIYLTTQGRLLALAAREGAAEVIWEYVLGAHVPGPVVLAADASLRVHSADGFLHAVTREGKQLWAPPHVGEPLGWAAPVTDEAGNTWTSAYGGGLIRVDAVGHLDEGGRRYFRSRRKFDSAGVIHRGALYLGSEDGYIFAIRLGAERGENVWDHAADRGYTGGFVNSSPALAQDGTLVVAARDGKLFGFAPDGAAAWKTEMPGQLLGSPVIDADGHIYVGVFIGSKGKSAAQRPGCGLLVSVDGNSHKIRWQYAAAGAVESTPVVGSDGVVYFGDNSGTIHAIAATNRGAALWTARLEAPVRSAGTIIAPGQLAFGLDDDTLVVLKCSSTTLAQGCWPKIFGT